MIQHPANMRHLAPRAVCLVLFCLSVTPPGKILAQVEPTPQPLPDQQASTRPDAPLPLDQIIANLEQRNRERANALHEYEGTRFYSMQYRGPWGKRDAEMVVSMSYQAPGIKKFNIVSQTGSKFIVNRVLKKLLESEQNAGDEENRKRTALTRENYDFKLDGLEETDGRKYVLQVIPKSNNKFLYRGKIWVDADDFAVTKIEAQPAKNPSFWIKRTEIQHKYVKVAGFWFPAANHTESWMRLGGRAVLSIEYKDYKITQAMQLQLDKDRHQSTPMKISELE